MGPVDSTPFMKLFDAHCHLQDDRLRPHLDAVMPRAGSAGVAASMCCGSDEGDWPLLPGLAERFKGVYLSFGLHPWSVANRTPHWLATLEQALKATPSAVGEIGLDHALDPSTFAEQESVFLDQIHLANTLGRPVSIHCRRAWGRLMELLDDKGWPACGFMIHSYSGSAELVAPLIRRGAFLSFSGAVTHDNHRRSREALVAVPLDRLLIETDSPDLLPSLPAGVSPVLTPEGKPVNEPRNLVRVLEVASRLLGVETSTLAMATWNNAQSLWGAGRSEGLPLPADRDS